MSNTRVYFSYIQADGTYTDFTEVTDDIKGRVPDVVEKVDSNDYDVGVFRFADFGLMLRNEDGRYSEPSNPISVFPFSRDRTLVKVTWDSNLSPIACGSTPCGYSALDHELEIFRGLIEDNATKFDLEKQEIKFKVLGLESITKKVDVPFADLNIGDDLQTIFYKFLNQTEINKYFTVDIANILPGNNIVLDDLADLENITVLDALQLLLGPSNSILYVRNLTVYIKERTPTNDFQYYFYGQASNNGAENIIDINNYSEGISRTFNYWTWEGQTILKKFVDSIERNGIRNKELSSTLITDTVKIGNILDSLITEFGFPKVEFDLVAPLDLEILQLYFLDKVSVDYQASFLPQGNQLLPLYGQARYGEARYPKAEYSVSIGADTPWKIMSRKINLKDGTIVFKVRRAN